MAGNTLTIGARFKPMSYAEMIAPVQGANQEFRALQEELDKLNLASSVWENMANKDTDPLAYQKYTNFSNTLKQLADALASLGLSPNSRKAISQMKGQYQSDILPIELAYKQRAQMADYYSKARAQNPTLMSNIDPSKLSLDKLIANPSLTPEYYSGNLLAEQVANKAKTMASEMLSTGQWTSTAGGLRLERIVKNGLSAADVALVQSGKGPQELQDLVNNTIKASPISSWENAESILPQAYQYAASGLYAGIGKKDIEAINNQAYITPELRYRMLKDAEAAALAKAKLDAANGGRPLSWESLGSVVDATKSRQSQGMQADIDFLKTLLTGNNFTTMLKPPVAEKSKTIKERMNTPLTGTDLYGLSSGSGGGQSHLTRNPNLEKYNALKQKYGTSNPSLLIEKLNYDIKKTTSEYSQTAIKTLDNTNLNNFLHGQLASYGKEEMRDMFKTKEGKKLKPEEITEALNINGRLTYNPESKELGIVNPKTKHLSYKMAKDVVANVPIPVLNAYGLPTGTINGDDYLNYIDTLYSQDPTNPALNGLITNFYDSIDAYSNQFNQAAPATSAKAAVTKTK